MAQFLWKRRRLCCPSLSGPCRNTEMSKHENPPYRTNTWTVGREMNNLLYHIDDFCAGWQGKVACSSAFAFVDGIFNDFGVLTGKGEHFYSSLLGGDSVVLGILIILLCLDLVLGVVRAVVRGRFMSAILARGVVKYPLYALYILLMSGISIAIERSLGFSAAGMLNTFVLYLISCEAFSVVRNMQRIGFKVPNPLFSFLRTLSTTVDTVFRMRFSQILHIGKRTQESDEGKRR